MFDTAPLKKFLPLLTALGGAGIAVAVMLFIQSSAFDSKACGVTLRDTSTSYEFVKPLLACNVGSTIESSSLKHLKATFTSIVDDAKANGDAVATSIYFRSLDSGDWTAVNIDDGYTPASLMKVPVLIAYLKNAQTNKNILTQQITITVDPTPGLVQEIPPEDSVVIGRSYTVEDLLRRMIVYSDNRALVLLTQHIDSSVFFEILEDLGLPAAENVNTYAISARLYSRFFRILYNATYLLPESSEHALDILSSSTYADGLRMGVADNITIAHKFGEAIVTLPDGTAGHELHDCGIIYTTPEPYTLCVMTRGNDADALASVIAKTSAAAYEFVVSE